MTVKNSSAPETTASTLDNAQAGFFPGLTTSMPGSSFHSLYTI